ncbi:MAG TPA: N-acetyltransferase [Candidatus Corynebacterium gallistercoris]|uniref:N-acetyltransferase n=1 Tax=Candidatus Corynebacterium gallistercoris TaxID=2838530 RepID=A0A9D1RYR7_9CORY|nr:N-acetyltransferase [Candidatus Corynebacterium gallistercoris]
MTEQKNLTDKEGTTVEVRVTPQGDAFAVYYSGEDNWAGATYFLDVKGERIFFHTIVGEEHEGKGLAGVLVAEALEATEADGLTVVPVCPYVKSWIEKKDWAGQVRQPNRDDLAVVKKHAE